MSVGMIEIQFQEAAKLAASIEDLATASRQLAKAEMQQSISDLNKVWQSESRTVLAGKEAKAVDRLLEEVKKLEGLAKDVEAQARKMYLAEITNNLCARTRIY